MTVKQHAAFWAWYNTGINGTRRSYQATSRILGVHPDTLKSWSDKFNWEEEAAVQDREITNRVEEIVVDTILEDAKKIIERQRHLIAKIYSKIEKMIDKMEPSIEQILRLMEYERTLGQSTKSSHESAGLNLTVLLGHVAPEVRGAIHRANGELLRSGRFDLLGSGLGSQGRN